MTTLHPSTPWDKRAWLDDMPFRLGTYVQTADPALVEVLARAGFDYVMIDGEHSPLSMETIKNLIIACSGNGIAPFVRVKQNIGALVMEPLDAGAYGVQIPQISTAQAAKEAIRSAKYHPLGERGANPYVRATGYSAQKFTDYIKWANDNTLVIIQVEGVEGISNIEAILDTPGLDVVWLGPYDLSQSMGRPGQVDHPDVIQKMKEVIEKARLRDIAVGTFADNVEAATRWIGLGLRLVAISYETRMLFERAKTIVDSMRAEILAS
ncbi:MAG: aldolase [Deltaproteobacteria bacterium]|nr:aldolase [Deltaproteobacteria bacterium]